eukprot:6188715-Pleurochrysis_carterae.AAC.2
MKLASAICTLRRRLLQPAEQRHEFRATAATACKYASYDLLVSRKLNQCSSGGSTAESNTRVLASWRRRVPRRWRAR